MKTANSRIIDFKGKKVKLVLKGDYKFKSLDEFEEYVLDALNFGIKTEMFKHDNKLHYYFFFV